MVDLSFPDVENTTCFPIVPTDVLDLSPNRLNWVSQPSLNYHCNQGNWLARPRPQLLCKPQRQDWDRNHFPKENEGDITRRLGMNADQVKVDAPPLGRFWLLTATGLLWQGNIAIDKPRLVKASLSIPWITGSSTWPSLLKWPRVYPRSRALTNNPGSQSKSSVTHQ